MYRTKTKKAKVLRRHQKIRTKISGNSSRPRLAIFRSNRFIYAQAIDDEGKVTIASASDMKEKKGTGLSRAKLVGGAIAKALLAKGIKKVVFDRGGFAYRGRILTLAQAAREGGLEF